MQTYDLQTKFDAFQLAGRVLESIASDAVIIKEFMSRGQKISEKMTAEMACLDGFFDEDLVNSPFRDLTNKYDKYRRQTIISLYKTSLSPSLCDDSSLAGSAENAKNLTVNGAFEYIEAYLENTAIYLRMPMLWHRKNTFVKAGGRTIPVDHAPLFGGSIASALRNAEGYESFPFKEFSTKTVHFLYVYNEESGSMIDNDNHDTKVTLDAIVQFLPGGDSPLNCDIFSSAEVDPSLEEGTYITVTPGKNSQLSSEKIMNFWRP